MWATHWKEVLMKEATRWGWRFTGASRCVDPDHGRRLRSHLRTSGPAVGNRVLNGNVEVSGKSHSDHNNGKWIRFGKACAHILGWHQEHQRSKRFSFCADSGYLDHCWYFVAAGKWDPSRQGNREIKFRIGINLGDVIQGKERIYDDGVNIAARLEAHLPTLGVYAFQKQHSIIIPRPSGAVAI